MLRVHRDDNLAKSRSKREPLDMVISMLQETLNCK